MTPRERFHAVVRCERPDRLPIVEWAGYWDQTVTRWMNEGLSELCPGTDATDAPALRACFGLDCWSQLWIRPRAASAPRPPHFGAPLIGNESEYEELLPHLYPQPAVDAGPVAGWRDSHEAGERVVWITLEGFFWYPRTLLGIENHLYSFYDLPQLLHRMNRDLLEFNLRALDEFCRVTTPDFATIAEDMSYNHGPMLSEELFDEFLAPYYRELTAALRERGVLTIVDSDGEVSPLIPWLKRVGVEGILPLERASGVDVAALRGEHPDFVMIGGYDKRVMHLGEAAMRGEFERLLRPARSGGFIPSVDHQTPPEVSLADYRLYLRLLGEYARSAAR